MPDGWQEHTDADGNRYFFNLTSRAVSWTRPIADAAVGGALAATPSAAPSLPGDHTVAIDDAAPMHLFDGDHMSGSGAPPPLPHGWRAVSCPARGEPTYFAHSSSRRATWAPPPTQ